MTKEEFMTIFNNYFANLKSLRVGLNPRGIFCAYCEYQRYIKRCHHKVSYGYFGWAKKNNIPSFGYAKTTNPSSLYNYHKRGLLALTKGEDFFDFVPQWYDFVTTTEEKTELPFTEPQVNSTQTIIELIRECHRERMDMEQKNHEELIKVLKTGFECTWKEIGRFTDIANQLLEVWKR